MLKQINQTLGQVQQSCTARTIDTRDVMEAIKDALNQGWGTTGNFSIPASYGYYAEGTMADVLCDGNYVYVVIKRQAANDASPLRLSSIQDRWKKSTQKRHAFKYLERAKQYGIKVPVNDAWFFVNYYKVA